MGTDVGVWVIGHMSECVRWGMGIWDFTLRALGRRHCEIGARVLGIGNGGGAFEV